jgi:hypothetical protein
MPAEISVVIPTFRRPALLKDAIESALVQHVPVEFTMIDDCTECLAKAVVKGFGSIDYRIGPTSLIRSKPSTDKVSRTYQLYNNYRRDYGSTGPLALKVLARTLGKFA